MRRVVPPLTLVLLLAAAAPAGAATLEPRPAKGRAVLVATDRVGNQATFVADRLVDVTFTYRRRGPSSRPVRLATRLAARGRSCPRRATSADRRRVGLISQSSAGRSFVNGTSSFRFLPGTSRVCVWAEEGSGAYRRLPALSPSFSRSLFAATVAEGTQGDLAVTASSVLSTSPITGTRTMDSLAGGDPCGVETGPLRTLTSGAIQKATTSLATGSVCNRVELQATSGTASASLAVGRTPVGAPARVLGHVGACDAEIVRNTPVPKEAAGAFLAAAGCRLGKIVDGEVENSQFPASGRVYALYYRGKSVDVAPKGTTIDVLVDTRR